MNLLIRVADVMDVASVVTALGAYQAPGLVVIVIDTQRTMYGLAARYGQQIFGSGSRYTLIDLMSGQPRGIETTIGVTV